MSSSTAKLIAHAFGAKCDLYEVFGVAKSATEKQITTAYRKLALRYHPDKHRGDATSKSESTAKFQAISAIHSLLNNADARALYDETGTIGSTDDDDAMGDGDSASFDMWVAYFARIFPKVTQEDITAFEKEYRFSEEEKHDVVEAYKTLKGSMQDILDSIMLCTDDDEERFAEMIEEELTKEGTDTPLKLYPQWKTYRLQKASKPAQKKKKDAKKVKEAAEAEELMQMIRNNQTQRTSGASGALALTAKRRERDFSSLIAGLESKYADPPKSKKGKKKPSTATAASAAAAMANGDEWEDEPSEEAFQATQKRLMQAKNKNKNI